MNITLLIHIHLIDLSSPDTITLHDVILPLHINRILKFSNAYLMEFIPDINTDSDKHLFSISVNDVIIQKIFKRLEEEVTGLKTKVNELNEIVMNAPKHNDIAELQASVRELKERSDEFTLQSKGDIGNFRLEYDDKIKAVKDSLTEQVNEAVFSVNNVVRAQNALIEEKVFELSKPTFEFQEMRNSVANISNSHQLLKKDIELTMKIVAGIFDEEKIHPSKRYDVRQVIHEATQEERDRLSEFDTRLDDTNSRIDAHDDILAKIACDPQNSLPVWQRVPEYSFEKKPKLPKLLSASTYIDYFEYLMKLGPTIQQIMKAFYKKIMILSSEIYDKKDDERSEEAKELKIDEDLVKQLYENVNELKIKSVSRAEVNDISRRVQDLENLGASTQKLAQIESTVADIQQKMVCRDELQERIDNLQNTMESKIQTVSLPEPKSSTGSSQPQTPKLSLGLPAKTAVTPRGQQAYRAMYDPNFNTGRAATELRTVKPNVKRIDSSLW